MLTLGLRRYINAEKDEAKPRQFSKGIKNIISWKNLIPVKFALNIFIENFSINLLIANGKIGKTTTKEVEYVHNVVVLTVLLTEVPKKLKRI